jgi:peptidylprolyl isomerase
VYTKARKSHLEEIITMPSSEKPTKTAPANTPRSARAKPKANQRQVPKPAAQEEKETATDELEAAETAERKTSAKLAATAAEAPERKTSSKPAAARESKVAPAAPRPEARVRKLTPQQQVHLARARRRQLNQRLILGITAVVVIAVIAYVTWQVITTNQTNARLASAHAAATATSAARATATENAVAPAVPPAVTGKTVTTSDGLQYIDIKVGTGATAAEGDTISVQYTGWVQSTQVKFDSSYDDNKNGQPTQFQLVGPDQNGVIQGWVEGVSGMKVGGKRRLIIPPALAYGANGSPPLIPANATLIFDIQLVSIDSVATPTPTTTTTPTPTPTPTDTPTPSS